MVQRVFRLADRPVKAIMTPRTEICWLDLSEAPQTHLDQVMAGNHSLFPVARDSLDDCVGVIRGRTYLAAQLSGGSIGRWRRFCSHLSTWGKAPAP